MRKYAFRHRRDLLNTRAAILKCWFGFVVWPNYSWLSSTTKTIPHSTFPNSLTSLFWLLCEIYFVLSSMKKWESGSCLLYCCSILCCTRVLVLPNETSTCGRFRLHFTSKQQQDIRCTVRKESPQSQNTRIFRYFHLITRDPGSDSVRPTYRQELTVKIIVTLYLAIGKFLL